LLHKKDHDVYFKGFSESQVSEMAKLERELKGLKIVYSSQEKALKGGGRETFLMVNKNQSLSLGNGTKKKSLDP